MHVKALKFILVIGLFLGIVTLFGIIAGAVSGRITLGNAYLGFLATAIICLLLSSAVKGLKGLAKAADQDTPGDR